jgi:spore maturation protein CgeB
MPEIKEIYGDSVPMYKDEKELLKLIDYYLKHDDERQRLAKKAQQITLRNYTAEQAVDKLEKIITQIKEKKVFENQR